jgi:two-component system cell cycle sensor histidine kinase/response regulator CckA
MAETGRVVLIVDDEPDILHVLCTALGRAGYLAKTASGAADAIRESRNLKGEIDLLLTDVVMPEMDGIELARQLATERPGLRVLLMSGYSHVKSTLPMLRKPFQIDELLQRIATAIEGPPAFDSPQQ